MHLGRVVECEGSRDAAAQGSKAYMRAYGLPDLLQGLGLDEGGAAGDGLLGEGLDLLELMDSVAA